MCETDPHKTHENNTLEEHKHPGVTLFSSSLSFLFYTQLTRETSTKSVASSLFMTSVGTYK